MVFFIYWKNYIVKSVKLINKTKLIQEIALLLIVRDNAVDFFSKCCVKRIKNKEIDRVSENRYESC